MSIFNVLVACHVLIVICFQERIDGWVQDLGGVVEVLSGDADGSIFNETSSDCLTSENVLSSSAEVLSRWKALRAEPTKS